MSVSGRVGQLHYWQQYLCTMWQCDMGILQFNSIHSRHASLNIRMLNDISENPSKYICNICYRLFLYVFIKAMLPEIDIMLTRLSNYVVFAARADLQHVYLRSCLLFFGWLYQDAAFFWNLPNQIYLGAETREIWKRYISSTLQIPQVWKPASYCSTNNHA